MSKTTQEPLTVTADQVKDFFNARENQGLRESSPTVRSVGARAYIPFPAALIDYAKSLEYPENGIAEPRPGTIQRKQNEEGGYTYHLAYLNPKDAAPGKLTSQYPNIETSCIQAPLNGTQSEELFGYIEARKNEDQSKPEYILNIIDKISEIQKRDGAEKGDVFDSVISKAAGVSYIDESKSVQVIEAQLKAGPVFAYKEGSEGSVFKVPNDTTMISKDWDGVPFHQYAKGPYVLFIDEKGNSNLCDARFAEENYINSATGQHIKFSELPEITPKHLGQMNGTVRTTPDMTMSAHGTLSLDSAMNISSSSTKDTWAQRASEAAKQNNNNRGGGGRT